jgi:hypothetical protein
MNIESKGRTALVIAILVPVLVIAALALAIYIPRQTSGTAYDFVYAMSAGADRVVVKDGKITMTVISRPEPYETKYIDTETGQEVGRTPTTLYRYNVADDTSTEISIADAKLLTVNSSPVSPDGFSIVDSRGGGGVFPFFYDNDSYGMKYLKSGLSTKKLNVTSYQSSPYEYKSFVFVGWVTE